MAGVIVMVSMRRRGRCGVGMIVAVCGVIVGAVGVVVVGMCGAGVRMVVMVMMVSFAAPNGGRQGPSLCPREPQA